MSVVVKGKLFYVLQIISIVLHWVTNHYGDFDGDDEMTGFLDRFEELLKGEVS